MNRLPACHRCRWISAGSRHRAELGFQNTQQLEEKGTTAEQLFSLPFPFYFFDSSRLGAIPSSYAFDSVFQSLPPYGLAGEEAQNLGFHIWVQDWVQVKA